ncbi:MAG: DNA repair protein RecO [Saprospiraceae bacterium]|nr:DNA repair protein RecO [Saprospiraceae bacterium]MDW8483170.1 DNA repair protein RecO [Saprospiraceae bacterium]
MLLRTRGIVIHTRKYGETSVISDIFTEARGLHGFIAGGVRTPKARMPYSLFQPMTVVELVCYFRDSPPRLNRLKEIRAALVFQRIPFDIHRGAVALFMAEVCRKILHEGEENPALFAFIEEYLRWLDQTEYPIANLHLHFLLHVSHHLGFQIAPIEATPVFFDIQEGIFRTTPPDHPLRLDVQVSTHMQQLLHYPLQRCHELNISKLERRTLLDGLLLFYRLRIPGFHTVHTPAILDMVLSKMEN